MSVHQNCLNRSALLNKMATRAKNRKTFKWLLLLNPGWSGGAMVLGKLPVPRRPTIWMKVGQGLTALAVGAGGGCLDLYSLIYPFSPLSPSLWETAWYRLKYCLKGHLNPKQPNQPILLNQFIDFEIIIQECSLDDCPPKLLKPFRSVEQNGYQGYK